MCALPKPVSVRQKSCHQCSIAKARCDLQRPSCSRCVSKTSTCQYPAQAQPVGHTNNAAPGEVPFQEYDAASRQSLRTFPIEDQNTHSIPHILLGTDDAALDDFYTQDLDPGEGIAGECFKPSSCSTESHMTGSTVVNTPENGPNGEEWMLSLLPQLNQADTTPLLAKNSMRILLRVFRTWPRMLVKEFQLPPIFHHTAVPLGKPLPQLLSNCFTLAKMWDCQLEGSSEMVQETVSRETKAIFSNVSPNKTFLCHLCSIVMHHSSTLMMKRISWQPYRLS